ncbi:uncharacterized protein MICPUCDRAFT_4421, partial [Micromonas pusilla CCMP1545]
DMPPTGITVVTGFLGAGKTTLVNYVLNADHGYRIAVILNEFGAELGVEKMLVQDKKGGDDDAAVEEWVEMNNGCVCCTVKGSLIQTIDSLMERRARSGKKFDFILLETTGLADPGPVAQELWVDDELLEEDGAVLDAVVTLVDASNIAKQLREGKEAALQIAHADVIVLNKLDLVSESDADEIERTLSTMNAEAKIVRSTRSVVALEHVLNQGAATGRGFWAKGVERYMPGNVAASAVHDAGIRTVCLAVEGRIDVRKFETWLEGLLWEGTKLAVLRAKGVLFAHDDDGATEAKKILQAVREVYEITPGPPSEPGERELNKVVLIGRGL